MSVLNKDELQIVVEESSSYARTLSDSEKSIKKKSLPRQRLDIFNVEVVKKQTGASYLHENDEQLHKSGIQQRRGRQCEQANTHQKQVFEQQSREEQSRGSREQHQERDEEKEQHNKEQHQDENAAVNTLRMNAVTTQEENVPFMKNFNFFQEIICFTSFFDSFRVFEDNIEQESFRYDESRGTYSDLTKVPSVIVLVGKQSSVRLEDGDSTSSVKSIHAKQKIFDRAESLYSFFDRDLNKTKTTTASTFAENSSIFAFGTGNASMNIAHNSSKDTTTLSDNDYDKDYLIVQVVSSISNPSFDNCSQKNLDFCEDDPLQILEIKDNVMTAIDKQQREKCSIRGNFLKELSLGSSDYQESIETKDDPELNAVKQDSLLSYEDENLDIVDGISYDDDDYTVSIGLNTLHGMENQFSEDEKADLDNLCQESIHSNSLKSLKAETNCFLNSL